MTVAAIASAASCVVPRWPTIAVSTSTYSGSAASAPSAGSARAKTSRSNERGIRSQPMKLRLYHHHDGARVAYREAGTGRPLALLHSRLLSHREWEPVVEELSHRYRLVLPDLPLHGDSEDRPRHPYTPDWLEEVMADFIRVTCGPRPLVGGHAEGALLLLRAVASGRLDPARIVVLPSTLHRRPERCARERLLRAGLRATVVPGAARVVSHVVPATFGPRF